VRATGSCNIKTGTGTVQGIHIRNCRPLHRADGYTYQKGEAALLPRRQRRGLCAARKMSDMSNMFDRLVRGRTPILMGIALCLTAGLAACGSASASTGSATATPNCTPARAGQAATSTGTISNVTASAFQLTDASGKVTSVQLTVNTRISRIVTGTAASLTPGAIVQVTADSTGTAAQSIVVASQAANGNGNGFRGGFRGTPPAGSSAACVGTRTPGRNNFQGNFAGIRGTVASATSTRVVVNDAQGQTLTFAITPTTQIRTTTSGSASDLAPGSTAVVTGTLAGTTLTARTIVIQKAAS
jgi:hypothetical protein